MKTAWVVLLISAFTDFLITAGGSITTAITTMTTPDWPPGYVFLIAGMLGLVSAARTIQQALKATPETRAALTGNVSTVASTTATTTLEKTP